MPEAGDNISVHCLEVIESFLEETVPESGSLGKVTLTGLHEESLIFARGDDQAAMEALAAEDPFVRGGVATVQVTHFQAARGGL